MKNLAARKKFGEHLRKARRARGLTLKQVATLSGVHPNYLGDAEQGRRNPTLDGIVRIARALRVDPADLVRGLR